MGMNFIFGSNVQIDLSHIDLAIKNIGSVFPEYSKALIESNNDLLITTSSCFNYKKFYFLTATSHYPYSRVFQAAQGISNFSTDLKKYYKGEWEIPVLTIALGAWLTEEFSQKVLEHELIHIAQRLHGFLETYLNEQGEIVTVWKKELSPEYRKNIEIEHSMPFEKEANLVSSQNAQEQEKMVRLADNYWRENLEAITLQSIVRETVILEKHDWEKAKFEGFTIYFNECF